MDLEEDSLFNTYMVVPLGILINELVSNSLKHEFKGRQNGETQIKLLREESIEYENGDCNTTFILTVSDNSVDIPENFEIEDLNILGMQLVTTLIEQLDSEF
jgi:two-component sensor histidine kinase